MFVDTSGSAGCTALAVSREASCGRAALLMRRVAALTVTRTALGGGILMGACLPGGAIIMPGQSAAVLSYIFHTFEYGIGFENHS